MGNEKINNAISLFDEYKSLADKGEEQMSLLLVYETLMDKLNEDDYNMCDSFMGLVKGYKLTDSDLLVHMLNILSTKKDKLINWEDFVEYCTDIFKSTGNEVLLKVIL